MDVFGGYLTNFRHSRALEKLNMKNLAMFLFKNIPLLNYKRKTRIIRVFAYRIVRFKIFPKTAAYF